MTASRDLQLCPECIQLYLKSTFRITFYHYLDNFSAEESAFVQRYCANDIYLNIWYIQTSHSAWRKICIKYIYNIIGLFPAVLSGWAVNCSDGAEAADRLSPGEAPAAVAELGPRGLRLDLVHQELPLLCHLAVASVSSKFERRTDY